MNPMDALQALKRRGFERHIAELLRLRREQGTGSFFTPEGDMQPYAKAYLYQWLTPDLPGGPEAIPSLHWDTATEPCTLEELKRQEGHPRHWAAAYRFVDVLSILEDEGTQLLTGTAADLDTDACRDAQMAEYQDSLTLIDDPRWDQADDDDRVVYLKTV
ncbi:hypothetical protein [Lamprobacter modestohalophilus]|nr:hypothetical protein [Lamprobacter modestohalophilus]